MNVPGVMARSAATLSSHRRELVRLDREESETFPLDHEWPPKVKDLEVTPSFWEDPDPTNTAVLTSDLIYEYNYEVGRMIRPFQEKHLNSASYDLTLGPRCLLDGEMVTLTEREPLLRIEPGSICLAPSRETLLIPHWLVATFNLKSRYIFRGLLMGTGPQIDPGFMGVLTCPLHNISCEAVTLRFCEPFAKVDFIRTSWGATVDFTGIEDEDDLYRKANEGKLSGYESAPVKLWPREENFKQPLTEPAGVQGSLGDLKEQVDRFRRLLFSFGGLGGLTLALLVIGTIVGLTAYTLTYTNGRIDDVENEAARAARVEAKEALQGLGYPERVGSSPADLEAP